MKNIKIALINCPKCGSCLPINREVLENNIKEKRVMSCVVCEFQFIIRKNSFYKPTIGQRVKILLHKIAKWFEKHQIGPIIGK